MDNKENWETPALAGVMEPIHNVAQARRRRPLDPDDLEVVKLTNLNRELRDQMEEDVARLQADLEALKCENARLQADGSAARRNCVEIRAELAQRTAQLAAKDKQTQQLMGRLKDQSSRITQLQTYRIKYESYKNAKPQPSKPAQAKKPEDADIQHRHLKVALADSQFQLKRLSQDMATYKTLSQMQKVRLNKQSDAKLAALRKHLEEENSNWLNRFEQRDQELKLQVEATKKKYEDQRQVYQSTMRTELARLKKLVEGDRDTKLAALHRQLEDLTKKSYAEKQAALDTLKKSYESQIQQLKTKHEKTLEQKHKQYDSQIKSVQAEKKTQQGLHERTKQELARLKEKLYDDLYVLRREKSGVEEELKEAGRRIEQLIIEKEQQKVMYEGKLKAYGEEMERTRIEHEEKLREAMERMRRQLEEVLKEQLVTTEGLETQLKDLESISQQQCGAYQKQVSQLNSYLEQRPSRQQDLKLIQQLETKLFRKQNQVQLLAKELKWHRLQLQNKQQTYNRIFSNGMHQIRVPTEHLNGNRMQQAKEFKLRKMVRSLLQQKEAKSQQQR